MAIDLASSGGEARWESGQLVDDHAMQETEVLPWMGDPGDSRGFVRVVDETLEDGSDRRVLQMHPKWVSNGTIKGWFPFAELPPNAQFRAGVGFLKGASNTDGVTFQVFAHHYERPNRRVWQRVSYLRKGYTGEIEEITADLSHLAGQEAAIELRVDAGDSAGQDWAVWVDPTIRRSREEYTSDVVPSDRRRYVITASRFHCGDESGPDWWGSDEVIWTFTTKLNEREHQTRVSREFGSVDSGDTKRFGLQGVKMDGPFNFSFQYEPFHLAPLQVHGNEGVPTPIGISVQLFEMDQGKNLEKSIKKAFEEAEGLPKVGDWVKIIPDCVRDYLVKVFEDDLMGSNTILFGSRMLERQLPAVGDSVEMKFDFGGQGGDLPFKVAGGPNYELYLEVERVADAE
jgi:hypothetical protein